MDYKAAKAFLEEAEQIYNGFLDPSMDTLFFDMESAEEHANYSAAPVMTADRNRFASNLYSRGNIGSAYPKTPAVGQFLARPSTAVRAVGYTSEAGKVFDPMLSHKTSRQKSSIGERKSLEPQEKYKNLEQKIQNLLEESILAGSGNSGNTEALNKAKEAWSLDRTLIRLRDQNGGTAFHNYDLTYSVFFNLANQYTKNEMYIEALNTFTAMTKNKTFPNVNRLKMNMGNIYFKMGIYQKAIKMYRMALDQVSNHHKQLRLKITHNIGILFIKMGQYSDAAASFEYIMSERADVKSGVHLVLCYYAIGDIEKIKSAFKALVEVHLDNEDDMPLHADLEETQANRYVFESIRTDELAEYYKVKKKEAEKSIIMIVDLISPIIEENFNEGYTWCIEIIKTSNFSWLANELELNKALVYLKQNETNQAIETLKFYEKKEPTMAANAVTNLTFIYLCMGDIQNAEIYAEKSRKIDSYNPAAFINSAVCDILQGNYEKAKSYLESALAIDMTSFEANYNLGLVMKLTGNLYEAEEIFNKIKQSMSHAKHPHVYYQLAKIQETLDPSSSTSLDSYLQLLGISNEMDSKLYQKVGEIYEGFNDRQEANQYYNEAYRINPSDISIASSIGSYYIKLQAVERAIYYYERAVLANPNDPNLMLRVASCFKHMHSPKSYLGLFEKIYARFPENLSCLRALMHVTKSQGMMDLHEKYSADYARIEKKIQKKQSAERVRSGRRIDNRNGTSTPRLDTAKSIKNSNGSNEYGSLKSNDSFGTLARAYPDPLGPPAERPRTGQVQRSISKDSDDDTLNAEDLLPM
ncbi:intraflagellar transport protein 88 homolog [Condylostylus longicornis]|uniref:intraflagellar transport protein 88 homolog n=1 Tax=Condylostylus longicornis TaxID=2530218 RepID=UPI00244E5054|nr:intraflagellar transport protein 88 homolog [Condylostylus longicornis]